MNWFAVMTKPQKEALADLNLRWLGFETYFPYRSTRPRSEKSKLLPHLTRIAYFSGYVFVKATRDMLPDVHCAFGVSSLVYAAGDEPYPIPEDVMQAIVDRLGISGKVIGKGPRKNSFLGRPGQKFRFGESSPWFGFYAEIVKVLDNKRLIAKFQQTLFGSAGRVVEAPIADVGELVEEQKQQGQTASGSPY